MTLGEILVAVIREMLGIPPGEKPPPRRRAPSIPRSPAWDDVVDADASPDPAREMPPTPPEPAWGAPAGPTGPIMETPAARRITGADLAELYAPGRSANPPPIPPVAAPTGEKRAKTPISRARGPRAALAEGFAERLRANPAAAREAFVYGEIFGPPKADRE
ncbi:MAG: hypothetical protein LBT97_10005 [Planctomycetota bacterium]|jgi:hypothetical protein|nr:hypothetical protein [Planctomycetota bacterium]